LILINNHRRGIRRHRINFDTGVNDWHRCCVLHKAILINDTIAIIVYLIVTDLSLSLATLGVVIGAVHLRAYAIGVFVNTDDAPFIRLAVAIIVNAIIAVLLSTGINLRILRCAIIHITDTIKIRV
jgi:hypothetical protein